MVWLKFFVTVRNDSVARQMFCCKQCRMVLRRLFLSKKTKVSVFLMSWISLTACNICQRAISQIIVYCLSTHTI